MALTSLCRKILDEPPSHMVACVPFTSNLFHRQKVHCVSVGKTSMARRLRVAAVHSVGVMFHRLWDRGGAETQWWPGPEWARMCMTSFSSSFFLVLNHSHSSHFCPRDRLSPGTCGGFFSSFVRMFLRAVAASCAGPACLMSHSFAQRIACSVGLYPGTILSTTLAVLAMDEMYCAPYVCSPVRHPMPPYLGGSLAMVQVTLLICVPSIAILRRHRGLLNRVLR